MAETAYYPYGGIHLLDAALEEACYKKFSKAIESITKNGNLARKDFMKRTLYLSEAYCLLWQNAETGDVDGRISSLYLKSGALACIMIDLYALGKIDIYSDTDRLKEGKANHLMIEVMDDSPTGTHLDDTMFIKMIALKKERAEKPRRSVMEWMAKCDGSDTVSVTLTNLVRRGILGKEHCGLFGSFHKYPMLDSSEEEALVHDMRRIALKGGDADSFMLALLMLTRTADDSYRFEDPILQKHFTKEDYKAAKRNIKALVELQERLVL